MRPPKVSVSARCFKREPCQGPTASTGGQLLTRPAPRKACVFARSKHRVAGTAGLTSLFGVMKSGRRRVEWRMFLVGGVLTLIGVAVEPRHRGPCRRSTAASFPGRGFSASCTPRVGAAGARRARTPCARVGPAKSTRARGGNDPCARPREGYRRWPISSFELGVLSIAECAEQRLEHAGTMFSGFLPLLRGSASQPSWKSMRHTSVGLAVQQHALIRMECGIEPEPALRRRLVPSSSRPRSGSDPGRCGPCFPGRAAGAFAGAPAIHKPRHSRLPRRYRPSGVCYRQGSRSRRAARRPPPCSSSAGRSTAASARRRSGQVALDVILLQVDERRACMPRSRAAGRSL